MRLQLLHSHLMILKSNIESQSIKVLSLAEPLEWDSTSHMSSNVRKFSSFFAGFSFSRFPTISPLYS